MKKANTKNIVSGILLILFFILSSMVSGQTKPEPKPVKDTIINNVKHPLYVGAKGGRYILVTSKSGNVYKKYFSKK